MRPLTRAQIRSVDQLAIEQLAIPGQILMENAGKNAAARIVSLLPPDASVAIIAGSGNNAGDGYAIARHLAVAGIQSSIYATTPPARLTGDALIHADIAQRLLIPVHLISSPSQLESASRDWHGSAILVDALLGTGFLGPLRPQMLATIKRINTIGSPGVRVVAIDLPSGLDADSGQPSPDAVRADLTITFVARKVGFDSPHALAFTGEIVVEPIGIPEAWIETALHARD